MRKTAFWSFIMFFVFSLAACGTGDKSGHDTASATLPPPQVRVAFLPTATLPPPEATATDAATPTATAAANVQAWPTVDDEQFLFDQIDNLMNEIDRRLNSTNTNP